MENEIKGKLNGELLKTLTIAAENGLRVGTIELITNKPDEIEADIHVRIIFELPSNSVKH